MWGFYQLPSICIPIIYLGTEEITKSGFMDPVNAVRTRPRTSTLTTSPWYLSQSQTSMSAWSLYLTAFKCLSSLLPPAYAYLSRAKDLLGEEMGESLPYIHSIIFEQSFHLGLQPFLLSVGSESEKWLNIWKLGNRLWWVGVAVLSLLITYPWFLWLYRFSDTLIDYLSILPLEIPCFTNHLHGALSVQSPWLHSSLSLITIIIPRVSEMWLSSF